MKKILIVLVGAIVLLTCSSCTTKSDFRTNISEITTCYFLGSGDGVKGSISVGERENPYIIDGTSQNLEHFSLVVLSFDNLPEQEEIVVNLVKNGSVKQETLFFNPINNTFMNDLGYKLSDSDVISIEYENYVIEFSKQDFQIDYKKALDIAEENLEEELLSCQVKHKFEAECYLKVLSSNENQQLFWAFSCVTIMGRTFNVVINVETGEVLSAN